jgi:hypothetical protein
MGIGEKLFSEAGRRIKNRKRNVDSLRAIFERLDGWKLHSDVDGKVQHRAIIQRDLFCVLMLLNGYWPMGDSEDP